MRRNLLFKKFAVAVAVVAFALVACDDSSSAPETSDLDYSSDSAALSSSDEQGFSSSGDDALSSSGTDNPISSSLIAESSSSFLPKSSATCLSMDTSCGWTAEQLCNMGQERYCISSSSSLAVSSSAVAESSSAGFLEECIDFARMCRNCDGPDCPIPFRPCSECYDEGAMAEDCVTGGVYKCKNGLWNLADRNQCLNVALIPCTGDSAKCGRVPCNSNAPKTVIDCGSGEEYVCADAYWTPMKETESCSRIIGAKNAFEGEQCSREEAGARTVDCARNMEYECLSAGFWQQINPTIGDTCLVEGSILEGYVETSAGARNHTIFMCYEGKWEKYRGAYESLRCVDAAVVRTPCDVNDAEKEWIHQGDCDYQCRNGEYVFVPKLANE